MSGVGRTKGVGAEKDDEATGLVAPPSPPVPGSETRRGAVVVLSSAAKGVVGRHFRLEPGVVVIGRGSEADIVLEDPGISRRHARIVCADGTYRIEDMESTNGLFVNGLRTTSEVLAHGDKIRIGSSSVLGFTIQDELEESVQRSLYESATRDPMTGLLNRRALMDALNIEFAYGERHKVPVSVVMADVDHFKVVNDTYGHLAGDHVLAGVAQALAAATRTEDRLGRYGGEEFIVVLRETASDAAFRCAERCRERVKAGVFFVQGKPVHVTISLGVATLGPSGPGSAEELVAEADRRLYEAKLAGRDRTVGAAEGDFELSERERRVHARIEADVPCVLLTPAGSRCLGRIRDVSAAGMLLVGPLQLAPPGAPLSVEVPATRAQPAALLTGRVAWIDERAQDCRYGLLFEDLGDAERSVLGAMIQGLVSAPGPGTRKHARIHRRVELTTHGAGDASVVMRNISRGGVGFTSDTEVQLGETISVEIKLGQLLEGVLVLRGEVANVRPGSGGQFQVGVRFAPLDLTEQQMIDDALRLLVARQAAGADEP